MDGFFNSAPWSDFYGPFPANNRHRPPMPSVAPSKSRSQRRPVASSTPVPAPAPAPKPTVVYILVHRSGADGRDGLRAAATKRALAPSEAATRIQKVFRGFQVRRMEKVSRIASEVDAIEEMLASRAEVEKIRSDPREKLRVDELLMRLLLRLDSVHGVRYYLRKVIRRATRMQEMVDSIPSAEELSEGQQSSANNLIRDAEEETERTVHTMQEKGRCRAIAREEDVGEKQPEVYLHAAGGKVEASKIIEAHEEEIVDDGFWCFPWMRNSTHRRKYQNAKLLAKDQLRRMISWFQVQRQQILTQRFALNPRRGKRMTKILAENQNLLQLVAALREQSTKQCKLIEGLTSRVSNLEHVLGRRKKDERLAKSL